MSLAISIPDTFNGPLDLLLHLIRRDEMDIHDIPVDRLARSYLEEIEKRELVNVDEGAEFLDLASRLLEIKSRMLLPPEERSEEGEEEEEEGPDPRAGLVAALLEYRRFKDAAKLLEDMAAEQARRYPRVAPRMEFAPPAAGVGEDASAGANDLMRAFQGLLDRMLSAISDGPDVIAYTEVSIATRAAQIVENLAAVETTRFSRLLSDKPTKGEMVGLFIAMLELIRQGRIIARQADNFSDIVIERRAAPAAASAPASRRAACAPKAFLPVPGRTPSRARRGAPAPAPAVFPAAPPALSVPRGRGGRFGGACAPRLSVPASLFPRIAGHAKKRPL